VIKDTGTDPELKQRLEALLALGEPDGEVAFAYSMKKAVDQFYETQVPDQVADLFPCAQPSSGSRQHDRCRLPAQYRPCDGSARHPHPRESQSLG
jgi:hypothetical protein